MPNKAYAKYLRSAAWKRTRKAALQRAAYRCQICNDHQGLVVHHRTYYQTPSTTATFPGGRRCGTTLASDTN